MQKLSVKWNVNPATVKRLTDSYLEKNLRNLEENLNFFSSSAAEYIEKEAILKGSSTGTKWHLFANKERGNEFGARYETGQMAKNVGFLPADEMQDGYSESEFGLFTGGDDYFMRQEYGFDLQIKNGVRKVPGMHSAQRAIKATRASFRKKMLSTGFMSGKTDKRGRAVLNLMGEGMSFDVAWRESAPEKSLAAREAYANYLRRIAESQIRQANMDLKWANNRRVIDALQIDRARAQEVYKQTVAERNRRRGKI